MAIDLRSTKIVGSLGSKHGVWGLTTLQWLPQYHMPTNRELERWSACDSEDFRVRILESPPELSISQQSNHYRYRKCPQATFQCDQILTTNFLVLFRGIKQIQQVFRLHFHNAWVEQLFCFLPVQVWYPKHVPEACGENAS